MNLQKSQSLPPNASPSWGSPALRPNASFSPNSMSTPPHRPPVSPRYTGNSHFAASPGVSPRYTGNSHFAASPGNDSAQFQGMNFQLSFRTPQPRPRHQSPKGSWSDGKGFRGNPHYYQGNDSRHDSPHHSPSFNPGGSDNIRLYYSPSMLEDPWSDCPPKPVDYWKKKTIGVTVPTSPQSQ